MKLYVSIHHASINRSRGVWDDVSYEGDFSISHARVHVIPAYLISFLPTGMKYQSK